MPALSKRAVRRALGRAGEAIRTALSALRFRVSHEAILHGSILALALAIAVALRLMPLRWGAYLSEFDPYWHYHVARYVVENGFPAFFTWRDPMVWYPWGRDVAKNTYLGVPFTTATIYIVLRSVGAPVSLEDVCIFFPVFMGALSVLAIYFLGREIGGSKVGLLSAFFLAVSGSHIQRTSLGFCDDETIGITMMILFSFFLLRAIDEERSEAASIGYSILAGLSLGYLCASWGASRYPFAIAGAFAIVLVVLKRYRPRLLSAYSIIFGLALFVAIHVPRLGLRFLWEMTVMPVIAAIALLALVELTRHVKKPRNKILLASVVLAILVASFATLTYLGFFKSVARKFVSVVNPIVRAEIPLFESVAEHKLSTWAIFFYELGAGIFFAIAGLFFAIREPNDKNLFLAIFGLTAIYAAASLVRLGILMAVPISILWALALDRLARPLVRVMEEAEEAMIERKAHAGKGLAAFGFTIMFLLTALSVAGAVDTANSPVTIACSSLPVKSYVPDWLEALNWMKENLPEDAVVASWWDYGYWIRVIANRTSLADNGTLNTTQIKLIATMFLSNETVAIEILKKLGATHVLVFTTFTSDGSDFVYGDENKARWMCAIAGLDEERFWKREDNRLTWTDEGKETVIYKLITYGRTKVITGFSAEEPSHFRLVFWSNGKAQSIGGRRVYARVFIYEIIYPE